MLFPLRVSDLKKAIRLCKQQIECITSCCHLKPEYKQKLFHIFISPDFQLETMCSQSQIPRLAAALASCAQLGTLSAGQRTWALHRLCKLLTSEFGPPIDVPTLLGFNLMYDETPIKLKYIGNQNMTKVSSTFSVVLKHKKQSYGQE